MSEIILYTTDDGLTKIDVQLEDETVWLTQEQMATLFGKAKSTINEHKKNIYEENELSEAGTMKKFGISEFHYIEKLLRGSEMERKTWGYGAIGATDETLSGVLRNARFLEEACRDEFE